MFALKVIGMFIAVFLFAWGIVGIVAFGWMAVPLAMVFMAFGALSFVLFARNDL